MKLEILEKDKYYHIYNRGINGDIIFKTDENMHYFLKLVEKYLTQNITILSYCLIPNHYHFLVRINCEPEIVTQALARHFNQEYENTPTQGFLTKVKEALEWFMKVINNLNEYLTGRTLKVTAINANSNFIKLFFKTTNV